MYIPTAQKRQNTVVVSVTLLTRRQTLYHASSTPLTTMDVGFGRATWTRRVMAVLASKDALCTRTSLLMSRRMVRYRPVFSWITHAVIGLASTQLILRRSPPAKTRYAGSDCQRFTPEKPIALTVTNSTTSTRSDTETAGADAACVTGRASEFRSRLAAYAQPDFFVPRAAPEYPQEPML